MPFPRLPGTFEIVSSIAAGCPHLGSEQDGPPLPGRVPGFIPAWAGSASSGTLRPRNPGRHPQSLEDRFARRSQRRPWIGSSRILVAAQNARIDEAGPRAAPYCVAPGPRQNRGC